MYLIFDIGGTKMRLAISKDGNTFDVPKIVPTPTSFNEAVSVFKTIAEELSGGQAIVAAGGGITGIKNKEKTIMVKSPHLPDWENKPLKEELEKAVGCPVYIENDSAIVGLGEAVVGAGKGSLIVAYITVSTGIGGARVVNGKIDANSMGFEPGHQIVDVYNGILTLEKLVSGSSLEKKFGRKPKEIKDDVLWKDLARILAIGIHNTILHWSPDVVVLGGSMMTGDPSIPIDETEKELSQIMKVFPNLPTIKKAELQDVGGLHGALVYLKQNI